MWHGESYQDICHRCGDAFVIKPNDKGSSVGVHKIYTASAFEQVHDQLNTSTCIVERCIVGRELTVGIIDGHALPVVEICPRDGFYDYEHKYTAGASDYFCPADIDQSVSKQMQTYTELLFREGGFRDVSRADFLLTVDNDCIFLEINTSPGMTSASLLPKAAKNIGLSFDDLCWKLLSLAVSRDRMQS